MAEIAVQPFVLNDVTLKIPTDDYAAACSSATLTPAASVVNWKGLKKTAVFSFGTTATWTLDLEYAQDWSEETSLSRYLYEHEGEVLDATLIPQAGGTSWDVSIIVTPGAIGGAVDSVATATVSLGVQGRPEPIDI